jgi:hypothetical protein
VAQTASEPGAGEQRPVRRLTLAEAVLERRCGVRFVLLLIACWLGAMATRAEQLESRVDRRARRELMRELSGKMIPAVAFKDSTLAECVTWLKTQGVSVEIAPELEEGRRPETIESTAEPKPRPRVTMTLKAVPASEVIKYVANLTDTKIAPRNGKLCFVPFGSQVVCNYLESWEGVPLAFFGEDARRIAAEPKVTIEAPPRKRNAVQDHFEKKGIRFQQGDFALYSVESKQLVIKHSTSEVIDQIDDLLADFLSKQRKPGEKPNKK